MGSSKRLGQRQRQRSGAGPVWLFDLDDTLHNASQASMGELALAMGHYIESELGLTPLQAHALRRLYWQRYGATLLGLIRHNGVNAADFLHRTHALPGLEGRVRGNAQDLHALARLPGRKFIFTNAPKAYAQRVLQALGLGRSFEAVVSIEDMRQFGHWRPKPDARSLRAWAATLRVHPRQCVLVEDSTTNLRAARRLGMKTVWMQRWLPPQAGWQQRLKHGAFVDHRVRSLRPLLRLKWAQTCR